MRKHLRKILVIAGIAFATTASQANDSRCEFVFYEAVRASSALSYKATVTQPRLLDWAERTNKEIANVDENNVSEHWHYNMPVRVIRKLKKVLATTVIEHDRIKSASETYFKNFGRDTVESLMWTGVESGNPLTRHEDYRWDSLEEQGLYDPTRRAKIISSLVSTGVRNVRVGLSNDKINLNNEASWKRYDEIIDEMAKAGLRMSLDLHHFGIEDRFRVVDVNGKTIGEQSYYLHKDWPDYFAKFARKAIERYGDKIKAITIMNEPETVAGFNGEMWHGGFPGWSDPRSNFYYIERSIQVAKASVQARLAIEAYLKTVPAKTRPQFTYMHTEAAVYKAYWEDFNLYRRFIISDLILGSDWVLNADLKWLKNAPMHELDGRWHRLPGAQRTNFDWVIENFIIYNRNPQTREQDRDRLVSILGTLQNRHRTLETRYKKTMKTDTIFAVDYYMHNEDKGKDGTRLNPEPQYYAKEIAAGNRAGLYDVIVDYYNRFKMPMMVGETGTPYFHYGARWAQQAMLDSALAAKQGIPFLGLTLYPLVDTFGWESALSVPKGPDVLYNPSGILQLAPGEKDPKKREELEYTPRPFVKVLMERLN